MTNPTYLECLWLTAKVLWQVALNFWPVFAVLILISLLMVIVRIRTRMAARRALVDSAVEVEDFLTRLSRMHIDYVEEAVKTEGRQINARLRKAILGVV